MSTCTASVSLISQKSISFTAFQALWIPGTNRICSLGSNDTGFGVIQVHALTTNPLSSPKVSSTATTATAKTSDHVIPTLLLHSETEKRVQFKSGTFRASARSSSLPNLITGDFEGHVGLWDLSRTEVPLNTFKAHEDVINCMDGTGSQTGRPEYVTGCRDGSVKLWDMRQNHKETKEVLPISNMSRTKGQKEADAWSVALGATGMDSDDLLIAIGYDNGDVRMVDIRMYRPIFERNIGHGVCSVEFDKRQGKPSILTATTLDGTLHTFTLAVEQTTETADVKDNVIQVQSGEDSTLWQVRHIPQRPDILTVTDGGGKIHMYKHGEKATKATSLGSQKMSTQGILSLEFNENLEGMFVGSDLDNNLQVGMIQL
ncbi:WD repeat-containing protein 92 [Lobosporangium transversale]|uniref:WD40-repeat-containing domain protein n=1 Tax=Lobosporangium transversale TaxID=64571 RepID=A0A1Y2G5Z9_9FUNG|nr:WD40-repeat-containing domain protein [Lobosporangium transversale]KAF9900656.1 WD repeat-containing protein 92 [Lobosporangium transversale]ORY96093.1 WD40-repeat-containing domain protein [Lobosporangium transversale]|eukprot:XP_021875512.1 WD40-repeat-containing domain protein [Lobosporangium transversale]